MRGWNCTKGDEIANFLLVRRPLSQKIAPSRKPDCKETPTSLASQRVKLCCLHINRTFGHITRLLWRLISVLCNNQRSAVSRTCRLFYPYLEPAVCQCIHLDRDKIHHQGWRYTFYRKLRNRVLLHRFLAKQDRHLCLQLALVQRKGTMSGCYCASQSRSITDESETEHHLLTRSPNVQSAKLKSEAIAKSCGTGRPCDGKINNTGTLRASLSQVSKNGNLTAGLYE